MRLNTVSENPMAQMHKLLFTGVSHATSAKRRVVHDPHFQAAPRQREGFE